MLNQCYFPDWELGQGGGVCWYVAACPYLGEMHTGVFRGERTTYLGFAFKRFKKEVDITESDGVMEQMQ